MKALAFVISVVGMVFVLAAAGPLDWLRWVLIGVGLFAVQVSGRIYEFEDRQ